MSLRVLLERLSNESVVRTKNKKRVLGFYFQQRCANIAKEMSCHGHISFKFVIAIFASRILE